VPARKPRARRVAYTIDTDKALAVTRREVKVIASDRGTTATEKHLVLNDLINHIKTLMLTIIGWGEAKARPGK
jgi:hypothetical protein